METQTEVEKSTHNNTGQLILVPHKDTIRLLEVYVKRSLSLNEASSDFKRTGKKEKWVTMPKRHRRHSSDPSIHLTEGFNGGDIGPFVAIKADPEGDVNIPEEKEKDDKEKEKEKEKEKDDKEKEKEKEKARKKTKRKKKSSLWKSFLSLFSPKDSEDKDEEQEGPSEMPEEEAVTFDPPAPSPAFAAKDKSVRRRSIRRRLSKKRLSFIKPNKPGKDLNSADITGVEAVVSVEPTYSYYEKVTEELEKIVHEVKEKEEVKALSDEEVIQRIIALTKEEGDAIDGKLKDNPTLSHFFQQMTYSSFQKLADAYLEKEALPTQTPPTLPTAPELVKLAFTLDFTARIAGLSRQNIGHITGLGNRYLKDRFEYKQACTDHPWSDSDD